jgi:ankyrin repeat protein
MAKIEAESNALAKVMLKAAKAGNLAEVRKLVAKDKSLLNIRDKEGSTPLHCAAWKGHVDVVTALLNAGAGINAVNQNGHYGTTPLHAAAHGNQRAVAELLIARGADMKAKNLSGRTPLGETTVHNATAVAKLLREHGAK